MSFFRGPLAPPPSPRLRLLQLHEFFETVTQQPVAHEPSHALRSACVEAAKAVWPSTGLSSWNSRDRAVGHCYLVGDGTHGFLHIDADHENCFLIVTFDARSNEPTAYILFDLGAEYAGAIYVCPAIDFEGDPTEELIETSIPLLLSHDDSFAVLELGEGTYMQTCQDEDGRYELEHQLVNISNHYRAIGTLDEQQVIAAFKSYAFGKKEWATDIKWEKIDLQTDG